MSLDFRRQLEGTLDLGGKLPATLIFERPNAESIASYIEECWLNTSDPTDSKESEVREVPDDSDPSTVSEKELMEMSETEVEALLLKRISTAAGSGRT